MVFSVAKRLFSGDETNHSLLTNFARLAEPCSISAINAEPPAPYSVAEGHHGFYVLPQRPCIFGGLTNDEYKSQCAASSAPRPHRMCIGRVSSAGVCSRPGRGRIR